MALDPRVLDASINKIVDDATDICLCSSDPALVWADFEAAELARKAPIAFGEIETSGSGRRVPVPSFNDGSWIASGTATHYAIVDRISELVLLTVPLSASEEGEAGQFWKVEAAFYLTFPGPA